jgi:hypothetical protein
VAPVCPVDPVSPIDPVAPVKPVPPRVPPAVFKNEPSGKVIPLPAPVIAIPLVASMILENTIVVSVSDGIPLLLLCFLNVIYIYTAPNILNGTKSN